MLAKHLDQYAESEPHMYNLLSHSFYVDDFVGGASGIEEGRVIYHKARRALEDGGFNLRKWHTNIPSLQEQMTADEKGSYEQVITDIKVLGLNWDAKCDQLCFDLSEILSYLYKLPPTKRSILKLSAKVFIH